MGRYCQKGDEILLEQLKSSNLKLLIGGSVGLPALERMELFPEAYPVEGNAPLPKKQRWQFSVFDIIAFASPVVLFLLLYIIYRFSLSGIGDNIVRTIL